jgi:DsbC/DsbD-like thiol-disulfide interchange protein
MNRLVFPLALALASLAVVLPASAEVGPWANGSRAKVRILSEGIGPDGRLAAGIEIVLPAGWHTYWRDPGTAGVAPKIDFAPSENVTKVDVAFPVPQRSDDGFSVTNVYDDRVILPVSVVVADPAKPVELSAKLDLGVCQTVCVPDHIEASLTVPPGEGDAAAAKILAAARALLPGAPQPGTFAVEGVSRHGGTEGKPVFRIRAAVPAGTDPVLFVEGPGDWSAYAPASAGRDGDMALYDVKFSRTGAKTPIAGVHLRITISAGGKAIEQTVGLD